MNNAASTASVPARSGRRKPQLSFSVAAVSLVAIALGLFSASEGLSAVGVARPALQTQAVVAPADDDPPTGDFSRFALNALLVPLLDDAEPPRWTDVGFNFFCGPATRVEVDGKPLVPGAVIPATAFTVRWHMDRCTPLDYASVELSGVVDLLVFHEDNGLSAIVNAGRLTILGAKGASRLRAPFAASMSLATAQYGP